MLIKLYNCAMYKYKKNHVYAVYRKFKLKKISGFITHRMINASYLKREIQRIFHI